MRKIDITTTQNVTIEYELATLFDRIFATAFDVFFVYSGTAIFMGILSLVSQHNLFSVYMYVTVPAVFIYHLLFEALNHGQSIGKAIFKIRVVKITGERPGFFDFMMRSAFRLIDITATLGTLALITISSSERGQRLGDFFSDTTVIRLININSFSLQRILKMEKLKENVPTYPNVVMFKEEEMLLIKETLERTRKYPNDAHTKALNMLVERIELQLGVKAPRDKRLFLNALIKDYVGLTR